MAGLHILKYADNLSDEEVCLRWVENPYYQYFCGEEFFSHTLPLDRSSMTRWRQRMGEESIQALLMESLAVAVKVGAAKPADFTQAIDDTTVRGEIARMWRFSRSNGITEGYHRKMKLIQRRAFGFRNFENYRKRVRVLCA